MAAKDTNKDNSKLVLHLDLLKSQSDYSKLSSKLYNWILSTGKYIFITVEAIMLIAFLIRFKLDTDLQVLKKEMDQKKQYLENLKSTETAIRHTQFKLKTINSFFATYIQYPKIVKDISDQTPPGIKFINLSLENQENKVIIKINAQAQTSNDISNFTAGLNSNDNFSDVTLTTLSVEQNIIKFSINLSATAKIES